MVFVPCSIGRQRNPLALAPKKSIALQSRWQSSAGVASILGGSGASVTTSLASQALPTVAPLLSVGWADVGIQGAPSEVTKQPVMATILLPTARRTGLPTTVVALTVAGAMQPVVTPPM